MPGDGHLNVRPSLTIRPSPRLQLSLGPGWTRNVDPAQYVGRAEAGSATHHLFGRIEQTTVSMNARLDVTVTPELTLELFAQPFLSTGFYTDFHRVAAPRSPSFDDRFHTFAVGTELREVDGPGSGRAWGYFAGDGEEPTYTFPDPGFRVRSLRGNAVLRWEYRPGSTLFMVWQQDRSLLGPSNDGIRLGRDLDDLLGVAGEHVFLLRATHWIGG